MPQFIEMFDDFCWNDMKWWYMVPISIPYDTIWYYHIPKNIIFGDICWSKETNSSHRSKDFNSWTNIIGQVTESTMPISSSVSCNSSSSHDLASKVKPSLPCNHVGCFTRQWRGIIKSSSSSIHSCKRSTWVSIVHNWYLHLCLMPHKSSSSAQ